MTTRGERIPGSARVSRAGDGVPAIANFYPTALKPVSARTPKPARETRALPGSTFRALDGMNAFARN